MSVNKTQVAVISGSILLVVLLLFSNTKLPPTKEQAKTPDHATFSESALKKVITDVIVNAEKSIPSTRVQEIEKMEKALSTTADKKIAFANIANLWDTLRQPLVAAYYTGRIAEASQTEKNWAEAGNRYHAAIPFAKETDRPLLYSKAMECFEKSLELNPKNMEAKINLAACYVEGSSDPMKGIGMLREVEKTDSNNVNLQLNFALFSEKSGQWDRAIARFQKVLKIKPDFIEAYLHLADIYQQIGNKIKAIECLKTYMDQVDDVTIKTEIQEHINKLKKS